MKQMVGFFENTNTIETPQIYLMKEKRKKAQINKIRHEKGDIINETTEKQRIIKNYYEQQIGKPRRNQKHFWIHVTYNN